MGIRIPSNKITNKYTSGGELIFKETHREYIGYYYELNDKIFTGKKVSSSDQELIKINSNKINRLLTNPATLMYGKISKTKLFNSSIQSHIFQNDQSIRFVDRYFVKKTNVPDIIKEVNKETYNTIKVDPIYVSITIKWDNEGSNTLTLENAEKRMSGIKKFLEGEDDILDNFEN